MAKQTSVYLFDDVAIDLAASISFAGKHGIDAIIVPVAHQHFSREFDQQKSAYKRHFKFTRSDLVLSPIEWINKTIARLGNCASGCDSIDRAVRKQSESMLLQEVAYAQHCLTSCGTMLVEIKGPDTLNLARILRRNVQGKSND